MGGVVTKRYVPLPQCSRLPFVFQTSLVKGEDGIITHHSYMMKRTAGKSLITSCICITLTLKHTMTLSYLTHSITECACAANMTFIYEWLVFLGQSSLLRLPQSGHMFYCCYSDQMGHSSFFGECISQHWHIASFRREFFMNLNGHCYKGVMLKTIHHYPFYPVGPAEEFSHYKNYGRKPLVEKLPPVVPG